MRTEECSSCHSFPQFNFPKNGDSLENRNNKKQFKKSLSKLLIVILPNLNFLGILGGFLLTITTLWGNSQPAVNGRDEICPVNQKRWCGSKEVNEFVGFQPCKILGMDIFPQC